MVLKANFHMHTREDPVDKLSYTIYEAVDYASKKGFEVLVFTPHKKFVWKKDYADYAIGKGVLLIPGVEASIEKKDVVIANCDELVNSVNTFDELVNYKKKNPHIFVLAPHPFVFSKKSLGEKLEEHIDLFDAVELSVFSNKFFNFNKKAIEMAEKYGKPLMATSDNHFIKDLGRGHILVDAKEKTAGAVFEAIKNKNFENKLNTMNLWDMLEFRAKAGLRRLKFTPPLSRK